MMDENVILAGILLKFLRFNSGIDLSYGTLLIDNSVELSDEEEKLLKEIAQRKDYKWVWEDKP